MLVHLCVTMSLISRIYNYLGFGSAQNTNTIEAAPAGAEKRDFNLKSEEALRAFVYGYPTLSGATVNNDTILTVPPMFAAIRYISEGVAMMNRKSKRRKKNGFLVDDMKHPLSLFFRTTPHPNYTWYGLLQATIANACLGNGYLWIHWDEMTRRPAMLQHVPQGYVTPVYIEGEMYYQVTGVLDGVSVSEYVAPCDMIHIRGFSTTAISGKLAHLVHRPTFSAAIASQTYTEAIYGNSARPSLAIKYSQPLDPDEYNRAEKNLMDRIGGAERAGKPLILDDGMDIQYLQWSPTEVNNIDFSKLNIDMVSMITKVPRDILADTGTGTYGSALQRNQNFLTHCLGPWVEQIQEEFNRKLYWRSEYEAGKRFFVLDSEIFLRMDRKTEAEMVAKLVASSVMTPNEARLKMGLPPVPNGDQLFSNINNLPLENLVEVAKAKYLSAAGEKYDGERQKVNNQPPTSKKGEAKKDTEDEAKQR